MVDSRTASQVLARRVAWTSMAASQVPLVAGSTLPACRVRRSSQRA